MKNILEASDKELAEQVLRGDTEVFAVLLDRYKNYVFHIVGKHVPFEEVEEVAQETFVQAFKSLAMYKGPKKFKSWLASIALNVCAGYWRKNARWREHETTELDTGTLDWVDKVLAQKSIWAFEAFTERQEAQELLDWMFGKVSPEERVLLGLLYMKEFSTSEIASMLDWSVPKVKVKAFRARAKIRKAYSRLEAQERRER